MHSPFSSDPATVEKITKSLSLTIPSHVLRSRDPRAILTTIFAAWLPLSTAVLVSVIEFLPAPPVAQASRLPQLIDASPGARYIRKSIRDAMIEFKASRQDPVVAFVSKMMSIPMRELPENRRRTGNGLSGEEAREIARRKRAEIARAAAETESSNDFQGVSQALEKTQINDAQENDGMSEAPSEDPEILIGFARLYSGSLSVGDAIYVLPPKFSPENPLAAPEPHKATVTGLYLMMGRGLETLTSVPAGAVFGIAGLEGHIYKSGTICSELEGGINLAGMNISTQPIVRVALEPDSPGDLAKLINGLHLLEQSDPCAQYEVLESGEHVISTAGELHLERCLKDLRERYARCEIQVGEPIVPYRESIVDASDMTPPKDKNLPRGTIIGVTNSRQVTIRLRVRPLPAAVTELLESNVEAIRALNSEKKAERSIENEGLNSHDADFKHHHDTDHSLNNNLGLLSLAEFRNKLQSAFATDKAQSEAWTDVVDKVVAFGPRRIGPNILFDVTQNGTCQTL